MSYLNIALEILKKLIDNNYESYIVGGYVRDNILNIKSNDIDITTSASIDEIKELFNVVENGTNYGSVTILYKDCSFEVTTFREDLIYNDNRHPIIKKAENLSDDLKRRDYTINALCYDVSLNIIDNYNGLLDINNKVVRLIGNVKERYKEDSLRILRGLYLVSKLDFDIEINTLNAMKEDMKLLFNISKSKITKELDKIIKYNKTNKVIKYMKDINLFNLYDSYDYLIKNNIIISDNILFYAYLMSRNEISFLELSKEDRKIVEKIIKYKDKIITKYDIINNDIDVLSYANTLRGILGYNYVKDFSNLVDSLEIKSFKDLNIDVKDIIESLNKDPGSWINDMLYDISYNILDKKIKNNKEEILKYILKKVK